ncbi:hypothetical protein M2277_001885 [Paenibacillus sp. LBL]|uniref:hypothetical protein n=1 Tax=Paenibacillus sp. LBL TaxID=2940563 RepID=UPI0024738415|nr:hypothetical protein [Paenibacillus sp. LBL]MDH6671235.1 hypothetical protein [Paenibacillus sp. LBL]
MKMVRKNLTLLMLILLLTACSIESEQAVKDISTSVQDQLNNKRDQDNVNVLAVKGGELQDYPNSTIGDAFTEFFRDPTWKNFKADTGENVVEFTGYMMYENATVKARLQFLLSEDDYFEVGALSFNDVPQNILMTNSLIAEIFESYESSE